MNGGPENQKQFDVRRNDLARRLKNAPSVPAQPKFTNEEMRNAAQRLMNSVLKTGKLVS